MLNIIAAIGEDNEIGYDNKLLSKQQHDMLNFKKLTINNIVIMGRKTFESINLIPLENRTNIILSSDKTLNNENVLVYNDINDLYHFCDLHKHSKEIFIIGGETIYRKFISSCDRMFITRIHTKFLNADRFFPYINLNIWDVKSIETHTKDNLNDYDYSFIIYEKK
jgi:dihydrofolate reductase